MNKLFLKEKSGTYISEKKKFKIAVYGISQGAGATTTAVTLAFFLSKKIEICSSDMGMRKRKELITLVEMERPCARKAGLFLSLDLGRRFGIDGFYDWFDQIEKGSTGRKHLNLYNGINWVVHSKCEGNTCLKEREYMLRGLPGNIIIVDSPSLEDLEYFDVIVAVVDPMPGKIIAGVSDVKQMQKQEEKGQNVLWVINCMNRNVPLKKMEFFLRIEDCITLPLLDREMFYECEYKGVFVGKRLIDYNAPETEDYIQKMENICEKILKIYERG